MSEPNLDELAAERDALAARVEELEARIARATAVLERTASWDDRITRALVALERPIGSAETWAQYGDNRSNAARRILRGEDER